MEKYYPHYIIKSFFHWGVDRATFIVFSLSIILHAILWFLRSALIEFNLVALYIGLAILLFNLLLTILFSRREKLIAYILGGVAMFAQIFLIILLVQAGQTLP